MKIVYRWQDDVKSDITYMIIDDGGTSFVDITRQRLYNELDPLIQEAFDKGMYADCYYIHEGVHDMLTERDVYQNMAKNRYSVEESLGLINECANMVTFGNIEAQDVLYLHQSIGILIETEKRLLLSRFWEKCA
tara:strand:- start:392 stop:793 length:402 start_codon:yes stop_codon:yes gene_type:complete